MALHTDYGYRGVLLIELLYIFRYDRMKQVVAGAVAFSWETTAPLAFIPVWFYNGNAGNPVNGSSTGFIRCIC